MEELPGCADSQRSVYKLKPQDRAMSPCLMLNLIMGNPALGFGSQNQASFSLHPLCEKLFSLSCTALQSGRNGILSSM